ncbi:PEGA domain-containing protein [candidate division KSB1 bacterium]|nr:PEGA domain-containing protein [candidate division KSB1 bacterium]
MIRYFKITLFIIFIFSVNGKALILNSGTVVENDSIACVNIFSEFDSLDIFLDGEKIGKTPLHNFLVGTGSHRITVLSPYWPSWNQPNFQDTFVALPGRTYQFNAAFVRNILVNSIPFDTNVYKNGELLGKTPLYITMNGSTQIRMEKEGYHSLTTDLTKAYEFSLLVTLEPQQEWFQAKEEKEKIKMSEIKKKRNLLFASIGLTTVSGLLSVHFRNERNDALNNSSRAGNHLQKEFYRDKAKQYENLQDLSYIAFELGFVLTGYFFLTSRAGD